MTCSYRLLLLAAEEDLDLTLAPPNPSAGLLLQTTTFGRPREPGPDPTTSWSTSVLTLTGKSVVSPSYTFQGGKFRKTHDPGRQRFENCTIREGKFENTRSRKGITENKISVMPSPCEGQVQVTCSYRLLLFWEEDVLRVLRSQ